MFHYLLNLSVNFLFFSFQGIVTTVIDERYKPVAPKMTASPSTEIMPTPTVKTSVTDYVKPTRLTLDPDTTKAVKNFKPMMTNRLMKLVNIAGKVIENMQRRNIHVIS